MKSSIRHIHFVGIGGVGMAGIAEVCLNLGYVVSGSDLRPSANTAHLQALGAQITLGHDARAAAGADVVVVSSAVPEENPEIQWARANRVPVIPRAMMLAELMRMRFGIAIAGTHGKTTTTSLTAAILTEGGLDPTYVIGGRLNATGSHAKLGGSQYLVAEADESDASFLHLLPHMAVITNIEPDHMRTYGGDFEKLKHTFVEFVQRLPFYGQVIVCYEDAVIRELMPRFERRTLTYGVSEMADIYARGIRYMGTQSHFEVVTPQGEFSVCLNMPGEHNVLNALAAITVALELDVPVMAIQRALKSFAGVGRRFDVAQGQLGKRHFILVDDYGHHPTEVAATLAAARSVWPSKQLWLVFQPHRYSRMAEQFDRFVSVLQQADGVILPPVYAAGELLLSGAEHTDLAQAMRMQGYDRVRAVMSLDEVEACLQPMLGEDDVVLVMGAGDIAQLAKRWREADEG